MKTLLFIFLLVSQFCVAQMTLKSSGGNTYAFNLPKNPTADFVVKGTGSSWQNIWADSTIITIQVQARDLEYIASAIFNDNDFEEVFDSIKVKFRKVENPPTGNAAVQVSGYVTDWTRIAIRLKGDITALSSNCANRVETVLRATGDTYLIAQLDQWDAAQVTRFSNMRQFGRDKLRRISTK